MLNNEQVVPQEVSQDETSLANQTPEMETSSEEMVSQDDAGNNEQNLDSTGETESNTLSYKEKEQHWRKREKKLSSENDYLKNTNAQLTSMLESLIQPSPETKNTSVQMGESQSTADKTLEEQLNELVVKKQTEVAQQEHFKTLTSFKSAMDERRKENPNLDDAANKFGEYVSKDMFGTLSYLKKGDKIATDEFLSDLLLNNPAELQRIKSLSPANQPRELVEKLIDFTIGRLAKKSNAPAPSKMGVKNQAAPRVVDPNKFDVRQHKEAIKEKVRRAHEEARKRWHQMKS